MNAAVFAGAVEDEIIYLSYVLKSLCWGLCDTVNEVGKQVRAAQEGHAARPFVKPPARVSHTNSPPLLIADQDLSGTSYN